MRLPLGFVTRVQWPWDVWTEVCPQGKSGQVGRQPGHAATQLLDVVYSSERMVMVQ